MRGRRGNSAVTPRHPTRFHRVRRRARDERGVAIVEAAFLSLAFFVLILGVFEIGLAMRDYLTVSSSVRAGARAASATGNEQRADLYTLVNISRESTAADAKDVIRIVVYKPSKFGEKPTPECMNGIPQPGVCNVYTPANVQQAVAQVKEETAAAAAGRAVNPSKIVFGCKTTSPDRHWCPTDRKVTMTLAGPDYVGVWMRLDHKWVTKFFGNAKTLEDQSVVRLEPRSE